MKPIFLTCALLASLSMAQAQPMEPQQDFTNAMQKAAQATRGTDVAAAERELAVAERLAYSPREKARIGMAKGNFYTQQKNYAKAIPAFRAVAYNQSIDAGTRINAFASLGRALQREGKYEEARTGYREALELSADPPFRVYQMQMRIVDSYSEEKKPELALQELLKMGERKDFDALTTSYLHLEIAKIHMQQKDYVKARESLEKVLAIDEAKATPVSLGDLRNNRQKAGLNLATTYTREKDYAAAQVELEKVLKMENLAAGNRIQAQEQLAKVEKAKAKVK